MRDKSVSGLNVSSPLTFSIDPIPEDASVADVLRWYTRFFRPIEGWGRTKQSILTKLNAELGNVAANGLSEADVIRYAMWRRSEGAGRVTISMDLSVLASALKMARYFGCRSFSTEAVVEARQALTCLKVIGQSRQRARRPSATELRVLLDYFQERRHPRAIPVHTLIEFALATGMRLGEIVRIQWDDVDYPNRTVLIRDRKHPRLKEGNLGVVPLLPDAWSLLQERPDKTGRIFPYNSHSVSRAFWEACNDLGIADLRFHDLRHEAFTRLFERGLGIQEVAVISGHKDWRSLKRYTHIQPSAVLLAYEALVSDRG